MSDWKYFLPNTSGERWYVAIVIAFYIAAAWVWLP